MEMVKGNGKLTLQNVKSSHNKLAYIWANEGNVLIENSDISGSSYIFTTSAEIKGSTLKFGSGANWVVKNSVLSATQTPIMMNVSLTASIQNSTLNGSWQCAMVRGGSLDLKGCILNYTRAEAFTEIASWGNGNNVPRAAITGGCKAPNAVAYNYPTSITIDNATAINMLGTYNTNPKIYLYGEGANTVTYSGPFTTENNVVMIGTGSETGKVEIK